MELNQIQNILESILKSGICRSADLSSADLSGADLSFVNLRFAQYNIETQGLTDKQKTKMNKE
jgi:uncharacterized protein YjbI with pentapeptide repeats